MNNFPDLPHLRQLQKDLWSWPKSRAAVMVGAGLSLNAEPLPSVTSKFLTWRQLVRVMYDELYPLLPQMDTQVREEKFAGINPLRIASEYEAAFGRRKLDLLLLEQNPDSDFQPGKLHKLLLQLPWADVFTTNYDTLLERTEVPGRAYQPVIKAEELTTAFSPRIVKLHGSFPSQSPFIISEEDYRAYPRNFAPFVNSVQQSLLENAFVLLGFSGDDPNFLAWTGWIRDELGDHHTPIYLVGALSLQPHQRSLLARRGVTPIDLTPLFSAHNPPQDVHAAAIEWFLYKLAEGKTPRPEKWPNLPLPSAVDLVGCPPILTQKIAVPDHENIPLNPQKPIDVETVNKVLSRWRSDRSRYPGWLVLNEAKRAVLWTSTTAWITPLLSFSESLPPIDSLAIFGEINWRLEVALIPLFSDWIQYFQRTFDDVFTDLSEGKKPSASVLNLTPELSELEYASTWFSGAFGLLREARESYNTERWKALRSKIDTLLPRYPVHTDRAIYESVLWAMWNVDHNKAKEQLDRWQPSPLFPLAGIWKAGLLAELDELGEARTLLRAALTEIRKALRNQGNNIELLSLEGWCTYILASVESAQDLKRYSAIREEFWERWQELKAWDCSPWPHKDYFDEALSKPTPKTHKSEVEVRGFDPGQVSVSRNWRGDLIEEYLPAFACIRLYEQVGIPLRMRHFDMTGGDTLGRACQWISPFINFWSPALLIRAGKTKAFKDGDFLSRTAVAAMELGLATRLYEWCFEIFERQLTKLTGLIPMGSAQEAVLETMPEVLSKLCIRISEELLRKTLPIVLHFNKQPGVKAHIKIHDSAEPWFRRLFYAADGKLLLEWLPQLIRAPLFEEGTPSVIQNGYAWPDPMKYFPLDRPREAAAVSPDLVTHIQEATDWLLRRATSESGEARQRALLRLTDIFHSKLMTRDQAKQLGTLLWSDREPNGLPFRPNFALFGFLHLPAPEDVDVQGAIKKNILSLSAHGVVVRDAEGRPSIKGGQWTRLPLIFEASLASKPIVQFQGEAMGGVEWTSSETQTLYTKAHEWWLGDKMVFELAGRGDPFTAISTDPVLNTLNEVGSFLSRAILPKMDWADEPTWTELLGWLQEIRGFDVFPTVALPYVLLHRPIHADTFAATIIGDLNSDKSKAVEAAAEATRRWIRLGALNRVPIPSADILSALINRVVFRRKAGISSCLDELSCLIVEVPELITLENITLLEKSLIPWHLATILPPSEIDAFEFYVGERPDMRVHLAHLAGALSLWREKKNPDIPDADSVQLWRDVCKTDPLPEIRRAFGIWKMREIK